MKWWKAIISSYLNKWVAMNEIDMRPGGSIRRGAVLGYEDNEEVVRSKYPNACVVFAGDVAVQ